jgi:hypothetical protein
LLLVLVLRLRLLCNHNDNPHDSWCWATRSACALTRTHRGNSSTHVSTTKSGTSTTTSFPTNTGPIARPVSSVSPSSRATSTPWRSEYLLINLLLISIIQDLVSTNARRARTRLLLLPYSAVVSIHYFRYYKLLSNKNARPSRTPAACSAFAW